MMTLNVKTIGGHTYNAEVKNNLDAVRFLRELQRLGILCARWEVVKDAQDKADENLSYYDLCDKCAKLIESTIKIGVKPEWVEGI